MSPSGAQPVVWYTRRGDVVQGPFPAGLITRYIILGRIVASDELSQDLAQWKPLSELPQLIPDFLRVDTEAARGRLEASRRWENERGEERRRDQAEIPDERRGVTDRRRRRDTAVRPVRHESVGEQLERENRSRFLSYGVAAALLVAVMAGLVLFRSQPAAESPDCRLAPGPAVNWDNCAMEGRALANSNLTGAHLKNMSLSGADLRDSRLARTDLSFTNLSLADLRRADLADATMVGASLRGADLSFASLAGADLSYADLENASLAGIRLQGVRLDHAVWVDGSLCLPGSVGRCLTAVPDVRAGE